MSSKTFCPYCSKNQESWSAYLKHANQIHLSQIATEWRCCVTCNNYFPTQDELLEHQKSAHSNDKKSKGRSTDRTNCDFCDSDFGDRQKYYRHCNKLHPKEILNKWPACKSCKLAFPSVAVLKAHTVNAHSRRKTVGEDQYEPDVQCVFCSKTFLNKRRYYNHANADHLDSITNSWFPCDTCGAYRPTMDILLRHQRVHSTEKDWVASYRCEFCPSVFGRSYIYYKHANREHLETITPIWNGCQTCGALFPTPEILHNHEITAHSVKKEIHEKLLCTFCTSTFSSATQYYRHCNKTHLKEVAQFWVLCSICQMYFPTVSVLQNHNASAHTERRGTTHRVECQFCQASFCRPQRYLKHANRIHRDIISKDWFPCSKCSTFHPSLVALRCHSNAAHRKETIEGDKRVKCQFCSSTFWGNAKYYQHANKKHPASVKKEWYACDYCPKSFPTPAVLKLHGSSAHSVKADDQEHVSCVYCNKPFTKKNDYHVHANKDHKEIVAKEWFACQMCQVFFPSKPALKLHQSADGCSPVVSNSSNGGVEYASCTFCDKTFHKPLDFYIHASKAHIVEITNRWIPCLICKVLFPSPKDLSSHVTSDHFSGELNKNSTDSIPCPFCSIFLRDEGDFYIHSNQRHLPEVMESWEFCDFCNFYFPTPEILKTHECETNGAYSDMEDNDDDNSNQDPISLRAEDPECEEIEDDDLDDNLNLNNFLQTELDGGDAADEDEDEEVSDNEVLPLSVEINEGFHQDDSSQSLENSKPSTSQASSRGTLNSDSNSEGVETYEGSLQFPVKKKARRSPGECDTCGKIFSSLSHLKRHIRTAHQNERCYKCPDCEKTFSQTGTLKKHHRFVHQLQRDFRCEPCGKDFVENKSLIRHNKNIHSIKPKSEQQARYSEPRDGYNLECDECGKRFKWNRELRRHINAVHLEVKNHGCTTCGKRFVDSYHLRRHIETVHLKMRNFACETCGKTFTERQKLKNHVQSFH